MIERYAKYLKELYKEKNRATLTWPVVKMNDFVNLLCVDKQKVQISVPEETVQGQLDEVPERETVMQLSDIAQTKNGSMPQRILVQGAPGSGKTTFSWKVCQKWGQRKLLRQYTLVVMLPLRDSDIQNATSLADFFPCSDRELQEEVAHEMSKSSGTGVLLLLDGFDELSSDKRSSSSLLLELITGKLLPQASIMVTSRPWAIQDLVQIEPRLPVSQHIEIVGFTKEDVAEYIGNAFSNSEAETEAGFLDYLATYPHIRSMMSVPLVCAIVVEVYRSSGSVFPTPKTVTQLYVALVRLLLQRHTESRQMQLSLSDRINTFFSERGIFKGVTSSIHQQLRNISRLAYRSLQGYQQLIFTELPVDFETLGLMEQVPQLYSEGKETVSYNFLHLTVQEFLAAYHILLQGQSMQQRCINGVLNFERDTEIAFSENELVVCTGSGEVVSKFVAGLSELKHKAWLSLDAGLMCNGDLTMASILFEAQNEALTSRLLSKAVQSVSSQGSAITPHGINALGYCISCSNSQWELEILNASGDQMEMLRRGASHWGQANGRIATCKVQFVEFAKEGLHHFLSLPHNTLGELTTLDLSKSLLDLETCKILTHHLSTSFTDHDDAKLVTLQELRLTGAGLNCECAHLLSQALYTNTSLRTLCLSHNRSIMDRGGCSLAQALGANKTVACIDIYATSIGLNSIRLFNETLKHNSTLRKLHLPYLSKLLFAKLEVSVDADHLRRRVHFTSSKVTVPQKEKHILQMYDEDLDLIVCELTHR